MSIEVGSLEEIGDFTIKAFSEYKSQIARSIFYHLMGTTPVRTGYLKSNWRAVPGNMGGSGKNKFVKGKHYSEPELQDLDEYTRGDHFTIFNNTPYIAIVNNGEGGNDHNQNFIQSAVHKAKVALSYTIY